jgi:hypothetical protein
MFLCGNFMDGLLSDWLAQMWADRQFKHRVDIGTTYSLQHKSEAQHNVGGNKSPVNHIGNHVDWFHADQRLAYHRKDKYAVADIDVDGTDIGA